MVAGIRTRIETGLADGSRWELARRAPCAALRPYVRDLMGYDERSPTPRSQRQYPKPYVVVIIEIGEPLRVTMGGDPRTTTGRRGGFVAGIDGIYATTEHDGHQSGIQVDLTPTGARRFLGLPLSELGGTAVALDDLRPRTHRELTERLAEAPDWATRLDLVEATLWQAISAAGVETARVDWALDRIERSGGNVRIESLSRELGCSPRHLIALFRDQVGLPPKSVARLVRFDGAMTRLQSGPPISLAELAADHGFSDQAHLVRDVRHYTGLTTTEARSLLPRVAELLG